MPQIVDIDAAKNRLAALDAEREPLLALIRAAEAYEGVVGKTLFERGNIHVRQRIRPTNVGRASPVMDMTIDAVVPILETLGPTTTSNLVEALRGKPELGLTAENAGNILSARMSNSAKFQSRRPQGWWFRDRPWPGETATDAVAQGRDPDEVIHKWVGHSDEGDEQALLE